MTPANVGDREAVARLTADIKEAMGDTVTLAYVDQDYTGETGDKTASAEGITWEDVNLPEGKRGFVLRPRRWVVEDPQPEPHAKIACQRLRAICQNLAGLYAVAFVGHMLKQSASLIQSE